MQARVLLPSKRSLSLVVAQAIRFASTSSTLSKDSCGTQSNGFITEYPGVRSKIIDGNALAETIRGEIRAGVDDLRTRGLPAPNLTVLLVGEDPASQTYVRNKRKAAKKVGMGGETIKLPSSTTQATLLSYIDDLNHAEDVNGILVQLPLPKHMHEKTVCNAVAPTKDVDGFHLVNVGQYCLGRPAFIPATPLGVLEILKRCQVPTFGRTACVVGRSKNIGFTLSTILSSDGYGTGRLTLGADATTITCHRYTPPVTLKQMTLLSDIVITATGVAGLIRGDMIKEGATVIDIGLVRTKDEDGKTKLVGDVAFEEVSQVASLITPVPGGVGPMTVTMVLQNTLDAARAHFGLERSDLLI